MSKVKSSRAVRDRKRAFEEARDITAIEEANVADDILFLSYQEGKISLEEYMYLEKDKIKRLGKRKRESRGNKGLMEIKREKKRIGKVEI